MKQVGGFRDYQALLGDDRAYEDVLIVLAGRSDAHKIQKMQAGQSG